MLTLPFDGGFPVAVEQNGAVIGRDDDQRVFILTGFLERFNDPADAPVEYGERIAARAEIGGALKTRMHHARHMIFVRRKVEKERIVLVGADEFLCLDEIGVGHVFILETGELPPVM